MSDLEQEVQAQRRAWYEINTLPEDWTKLKWELEVDEDLPDYTDGIPDGYPCWDTVRERMYDKHRAVGRANRKELRDLLSDYFGGKPPNLKAPRLKKKLKLCGVREEMPVWDCLKAILFYAIVASGMLLIFGGICYMMHRVSMYPGW